MQKVFKSVIRIQVFCGVRIVSIVLSGERTGIMKKVFHLSLVLCICFFAGCSEKKEEPAAPPEPQVFEITSTEVVVEEKELPEVVGTKIVRADFNMDMLEDLALAEEDSEGQSAISIYIQKKTEGMEKKFYKAGRISERGDYTISALMTRKADDHTDLIVMFKYPNGGKDMVYYRSDGTSFREIQREIRDKGVSEGSK